MSERITPADVVRLTDATAEFPEFKFGPVSLSLERGKVYAVLGPNGSGKSTFLKTLLGEVVLDSGRVEILGFETTHGRPSATTLRSVGVVSGSESLINEFTAAETIVLAANIYARVSGEFDELVDSAHRLSRFLDLNPGDRPVKAFSQGMRQKLALVVGLMHQPELILLDEPANGLDPVSAYKFEALVADAKARGATVVMASHDLRWAADEPDEIILFSGGRVLAKQSPDEFADGRHFADAFFDAIGISRDVPLGETRTVDCGVSENIS